LAESIYRLLSEVAGMNVWYDAKEMDGGELIGTGLQNAIEKCRGALILASSQAIDKGWVIQEYNIALDESTRSRDFRLIPLRVGDAPMDRLVRGVSWIPIPDGPLTPEAAGAILRAFHPGERRPKPSTSRDVYVSAPWRSDNASALAVCKKLVDVGFRLIGDAKDQKGFGDDRIQRIIESCGAFVGVIPYRGDVPATATEKPYKYFLTELDLAGKADLPSVIIADPRVRRTDGDDSSWLRMDTQAVSCPGEVESALGNLWDSWQTPPGPHYIFFATDLDSPSSHRTSDLRALMERVTGMPTVVGNEIEQPPLQQSILRSLSGALLVVADLSGVENGFNLEVCIEAGMARAAGLARASGRSLAILAAGPPRRPPFMLRDLQMPTYEDAVDQIGLIYRIVLPYRRRVINAEL
jgi:hypothetical protein